MSATGSVKVITNPLDEELANTKLVGSPGLPEDKNPLNVAKYKLEALKRIINEMDNNDLTVKEFKNTINNTIYDNRDLIKDNKKKLIII